MLGLYLLRRAFEELELDSNALQRSSEEDLHAQDDSFLIDRFHLQRLSGRRDRGFLDALLPKSAFQWRM